MTAPEPVRRPATPAERAVLEAFALRWASWQRPGTSAWELGGPALMMLAAAAVLVALGHGLGPWFGAAGGIAGGAALGIAWRNRYFAPSPSPHPVDDEVLETTVRPRAVVVTVDDQGDGMLWILFALEGSWWVLSSEDLPYEEDRDLVPVLAHAEVRWTRSVSGLPLTVEGHGPAVPARGVPTSLDRPALHEAIAAGWCWSPDPNDAGEGLLSPDALPPWVTDPSVAPTPLER